jgi:N4-gp56 family major capsid protein
MANVMVFGPGTTPGQGGTLPPEVRQAYAVQLLLAARPALVHAQFCDDKPIPKMSGTTMHMRRFELLTPATTPLTEGVTPAGNTLTVTDVPVSIQQFGDFIVLSDMFSWVAIDPILTEAADVLGFQAGQTLDQLSRNFMNIGTSVIYAGGAVSRAALTVNNKYTSVEIKKSTRALQKVYAAPYDGQNYIAIVSPDTVYDIQSTSEWLNTGEYSDPEAIFSGEVGRLYGIRYIQSGIATIFAGAGAAGQDIHGTLTFGKNAFGKAEIAGENLQMVVKGLGQAGFDPLRYGRAV